MRNIFRKKNAIPLILFTQVLFAGSNLCLAADDPPALSSIFSIIANILSVAVTVAGLVLVVMIAYGVWKSSMATGDPRGLEGAKQTWTYAVYGFFVVVGFTAIIMIIGKLLGINLSPSGFLGNVSGAVNSLINPN